MLLTDPNAMHGPHFRSHSNTEQLETAAWTYVRSAVVLTHSRRQRTPVAPRAPVRIAACTRTSSTKMLIQRNTT